MTNIKQIYINVLFVVESKIVFSTKFQINIIQNKFISSTSCLNLSKNRKKTKVLKHKLLLIRVFPYYTKLALVNFAIRLTLQFKYKNNNYLSKMYTLYTNLVLTSSGQKQFYFPSNVFELKC